MIDMEQLMLDALPWFQTGLPIPFSTNVARFLPRRAQNHGWRLRLRFALDPNDPEETHAIDALLEARPLRPGSDRESWVLSLALEGERYSRTSRPGQQVRDKLLKPATLAEFALPQIRAWLASEAISEMRENVAKAQARRATLQELRSELAAALGCPELASGGGATITKFYAGQRYYEAQSRYVNLECQTDATEPAVTVNVKLPHHLAVMVCQYIGAEIAPALTLEGLAAEGGE